ncbi:MAG: glycerate kinase type-2 family protein [Gammaproteobacteria bacterium]
MNSTAASLRQAEDASLKARREQALQLFKLGVVAADPAHAVKRALRVRDSRLEILNDPASPEQGARSENWRKVHVAAFGKAACSMARAALDIVPPALIAGEGIALTHYDNATAVPGMRVLGAGHPLPDESGHRGTHAIMEYAAQAQQNELFLVLVSGGGSALTPCPPEGIALNDKVAATQLLLDCGADIMQINTVRKHLSQFKGGGLARLVYPGSLHALILSDVIGDDLSTIASGPTVPDPTTFAEAIAVFESRNVWAQVPAPIRQHLVRGESGEIAETPKPGDEVFARAGHTLVASNSVSLNALSDAAAEAGRTVRLFSSALCGEARTEAVRVAAVLEQALADDTDRPLAIIAGGETTVTIKGNGRGGRNQELALSFALEAQRLGLPDRWVFLSGGTDGRDGPTDAAGGVVDAASPARMRAAQIDPDARLADNDSYAALAASGDLLMTGPTGTNVADLQILLVN